MRVIDLEIMELQNTIPDFQYSNNRQKRIKFVVAIIICARLLNKFDYSKEDLINMDTNLITKEIVRETWGFVKDNYGYEFMVKRWYLNEVFKKASVKWNITQGMDFLIHHDTLFNEKANKAIQENEKWNAMADAVKKELPPLPWNHSVAKPIALKLSLSSNLVKKIIQYLMVNGETKADNR